MSWDFWMTDQDGECVEDLNYTCNVAPMFYDAIPGDTGIRRLDGHQGHDVALLVGAAISAMKRDPEKYKAMNPENGWGDYEGALNLLQQIYDWAIEYPLGRIEVS